MTLLKTEGKYEVDEATLKAIRDLFVGDFAVEEQAEKTIAEVYDQYQYIMDTHTAVGMNVYHKYKERTGDQTVTVIVSTASPFKFSGAVLKSLLGEAEIEGKTEIENLDLLAEKFDMKIPKGLSGLDQKEIRHKRVCDKEDMIQCINDIIEKG